MLVPAPLLAALLLVLSLVLPPPREVCSLFFLCNVPLPLARSFVLLFLLFAICFCCCFVMNRFVRSEVEGARPRFRAAQFLQEASPTVHVYAHDRGGEEFLHVLVK